MNTPHIQKQPNCLPGRTGCPIKHNQKEKGLSTNNPFFFHLHQQPILFYQDIQMDRCPYCHSFDVCYALIDKLGVAMMLTSDLSSLRWKGLSNQPAPLNQIPKTMCFKQRLQLFGNLSEKKKKKKMIFSTLLPMVNLEFSKRNPIVRDLEYL